MRIGWKAAEGLGECKVTGRGLGGGWNWVECKVTGRGLGGGWNWVEGYLIKSVIDPRGSGSLKGPRNSSYLNQDKG